MNMFTLKEELRKLTEKIEALEAKEKAMLINKYISTPVHRKEIEEYVYLYDTKKPIPEGMGRALLARILSAGLEGQVNLIKGSDSTRYWDKKAFTSITRIMLGDAWDKHLFAADLGKACECPVFQVFCDELGL